ncbi:MAG: carboxy terminal-processing peptidase [Planctomycetaceae bacterium]|nr:carboxy terminal-processing peptidase [Planctomycetaceae bacterium]
MTTIRTHRTLLLLVFAFLLSAAMFSTNTWRGTVQGSQEPLLPLRPNLQERLVTRSFVDALERHHISQRILDQAVSKEAFRLYIKALDPQKIFFYQSDIDEFRMKYESRLTDLMKQQPVDVRPAFEIYNRYLTRLEERVSMILQILANPIDFTADEYHAFDRLADFAIDENVVRERGLQTFPKTTEEAYERWRKRIKSEMLALMAERTSSEQKREKDIAAGREPEELDDRDPVDRLRQRYISRQRRTLLEGRIDNAEILASVRQQANDDVMELFLNAVAGALDPHSSYMSPSTEASFNAGIGKNFQGIGATLYAEDGFIVVRDVIKGSPAERSGEIRPKDKIQGVGQGRDGKIEEVIDFKITDVVKLIRGEKGTVVRLDILPGGKGPSKIVEIVRDEINLDEQAALSAIFEAGLKPDGTPFRIGMIELPDFYFDMQAARQRAANIRSATEDVRKILAGFVEEDVDAVILDLRFNGGGVLQEAIGITNLFLGAGVVVQVKDESRTRPQARGTTDTTTDWTGPLVVLTNKFSASASEILAGAIQDYRRGLIIGDSITHGKGTVQSVLDLNMTASSNLGSGKITIQGYYRPSGTSPQGLGVESDIVLPSLTDAMEGVLESDLDNALTLQRIATAPGFSQRPFVSPQIIAELTRRSNQRIGQSEDFEKELERISAYRDARARRVTPLNKDRYMEEIKRFNADEWEREEFEDLANKGREIKRDFYVDEVLAITVDYLKAAQEFGIAFPRERSIRQPPQRRTLFGGLGF